jgi:hypothetical protein
MGAVQAETPAVAALEAGDRTRDVYMGIDVFGRGTYAGGQLNCYVAAAAALQEGMHVAPLPVFPWIPFAPLVEWSRMPKMKSAAFLTDSAA